MKNSRPSNFVIRIFVAILLVLAFFMIGALLNYLSKEFSDSDELPQEPEQELLN